MRKVTPVVIFTGLMLILAACGASDVTPHTTPTREATGTAFTTPTSEPTRPSSDGPTAAAPTATPIAAGLDPADLPSRFVGVFPEWSIARLGQGQLSLLKVSPYGRFLAVGGTTGVMVYDAQSLELMWAGRTPGMVTALAWSPNGGQLAAGTYYGPVIIWDSLGGARQMTTETVSYTVGSLDWSPDGTRLIVGDDDGHWESIDTLTGITQISIPRNDGGPNASYRTHGIHSMYGTLSPDGETYATIYEQGSGDAFGPDSVIVLWDRESGRQVRLIETHSVETIAWSPDGRRLAAYVDQAIEVWDPETGELITSFSNPRSAFSEPHFAWSPDGEHLASGFGDHQSQVLDARSGSAPFGSLSGPLSQGIYPEWSPDGTRIALFDRVAHQVGVFDVTTGTAVSNLDGVSRSGTFSRDWKTYFGWGGPKGASLDVWNVDTGQRIKRLVTGSESVVDVSWSSDGTRLATIGGGNVMGTFVGPVTIWDVGSRTAVRQFAVDVPPIAWRPGAEELEIGLHTGVFKVDTQSWGASRAVDGNTPPKAFAFSPDGQRFAVIDDDTLRVFDKTVDFKQIEVSVGSGLDAIAWSPNGRLIATSGSKDVVRVWDAFNGRDTAILADRVENKINVAFSADSTRLAATGAAYSFSEDCHTTIVWSMLTSEVMFLIQNRDPYWGSCASDVAWSPDGSTLAIAYGQGPFNRNWPGFRVDGPSSVALFNAGTGELYALLVGHSTSVEAIEFSPDGTLLASASMDGTVIVWDIQQAANLEPTPTP